MLNKNTILLWPEKNSSRAIRSFSTIITKSFYSNLLKIDGIFLEEAINKKPISNQQNRIPLTSIAMIEKVLMIPNRDIQISFGSSNIVVFDFDFHKSPNETEREVMKEKILEIAKHFQITTVSSKSGGLHLYLNKDNTEVKNAIGITLACLIPMVDVCSIKIIGPNFNERTIVAFCGFLTKIPKIFLPLNLKESKLLDSNKPHKSFVECWNKGYRRRTLLSLIAVKYLSKDMITQINKFMFNPPKSEEELDSEVLDKIENIYTRNDYDEFLYQNNKIKDIRFNAGSNTFFLWEEKDSSYVKIEINDVLDIIKSIISFENYEKYIKKYLLQIKEYNTFSNLKKKSSFEFTNASFDIDSKKLSSVSNDSKRDRHPNNLLNCSINIESFNDKTLDENSNEDFLEVIQKIAPKHFAFIMQKFGNFKEGTQKEFTKLILDVCFLVFLKNSHSFSDFCPKKILWFYGQGGTGKSQLIDFISSFLNADKITASDFSCLTKNFETGGWLDKKLVLFNDESLSSKKSSLDNQVSSMIKKITGGDLIRVEEKFKMAQSSRLNLFLFCSMNYQVNSGDTTNFVAMNRRAVKIPLLNFVKVKDRVDNFTSTLPKSEKELIIQFFLNNLQKFDEVFKRFNQSNVDHILLRNEETEYYSLIDPIFAFLSLKCGYEKRSEKTTFYKFYAQYIKYHFLEFDTLITIEKFDEFLDLIEQVTKDEFNTEKFNSLSKLVSVLATNLGQLDPLLHLPFLSQNTFMSFFSIIESRLPFLLEEIDLNTIKMVSDTGTYYDTILKKEVTIRLICVKGINFLPINKSYNCVNKKDLLTDVETFELVKSSVSDINSLSNISTLDYLDSVNRMISFACAEIDVFKLPDKKIDCNLSPKQDSSVLNKT